MLENGSFKERIFWTGSWVKKNKWPKRLMGRANGRHLIQESSWPTSWAASFHANYRTVFQPQSVSANRFKCKFCWSDWTVATTTCDIQPNTRILHIHEKCFWQRWGVASANFSWMTRLWIIESMRSLNRILIAITLWANFAVFHQFCHLSSRHAWEPTNNEAFDQLSHLTVLSRILAIYFRPDVIYRSRYAHHLFIRL